MVSSEVWLRQTSRPVRPVKIDTDAPNVARVWNYLVGGRDNFAADRRAAKLLISVARWFSSSTFRNVCRIANGDRFSFRL